MPDSNSNTLPILPSECITSGNPLLNLSEIQRRVDSLSHILSNSVNGKTPLSKDQSDTISAELSSAIHHIIINGAALLTFSSQAVHPMPMKEGDDVEIVELDVMELTTELSHTCGVCGKGFKRDANLRMHMRAHGDKFKTLESLSNPNNLKHSDNKDREKRFSCPAVGCNRNKKHKDFRALKSVVCVKNHFKRAHCLKKFPCNRCNKKRFSVLSDLKSHLKHCSAVEEENKWECSCGKRFLNKDELFDHMGSFEGHMPAAGTSNFNVVEDEQSEIWDLGLKADDERFKDMGFWSSIEEFLQS